MPELLTRASIGMLAPDFALVYADGRRVTRDELRGRPAILAFYPQHWDPARAEQLAHFNAMVSSAPAIGSDVPLLADLDPYGDAAERFGVLGEHAMFVLDADGIIRWSHVGALSQPDIDALGESVETRSLASFATTNRDIVPTEGRDLLFNPSRREFIATVLAAAVVLAATPVAAKAESVAKSLSPKDVGAIPVTLNVNGRAVALNIEPRVTLLDALREYAGFTGTKKGCDHGQCGACTVHIDGRRQLSCLTFAIMHTNAKITTVEGLASGDTLHPMQAAFIKHDGFQCGYCTPGQLMSATALLREPCGNADSDVKECMSGNICRCGAYPGIVAAIQEVRTTSRG
ncbi:MAG: 2Fe-2S iron-sulfur cluster-binding protein [bacterium]